MTLEKEIVKIFGVDYASEEFSKKAVRDEYSNEMMRVASEYGWNDTYLAIYQYLLNDVRGKEQTINFAALYSYYRLTEKNIPNPIEFCTLLAHRFNIADSWDRGGETVNTTIAEILITSDILDEEEFEDYRVYEDEKFMKQR